MGRGKIGCGASTRAAIKTRDELNGKRTPEQRQTMILEALRDAPCPLSAPEIQELVKRCQTFYLKVAETRAFLVALEGRGLVRQFGQGEMATSRWEGVYKYGPLWGPKEPE